MTKLRFGVLGTANIARNQVNPAIRSSSNAELVAVASREPERAKAFAEAGGIPRSFGSYEALLDDDGIDAVYVPLPNSLHREWTIRAAEKGKHILCEKPLATAVSDCREMQAAADANGVRLMEAFMYRFHPRTLRFLELVSSGTVGPVRVARSAFTFRLLRPDNIRFFRSLGGGSLFDLGCYCVDFSRRLLGAEPVEAQAFAVWNEQGIDTQLAACLRFADGRTAQFDSSFLMERREFFEAAGLEATLVSPTHTFVNSLDDVEIIERRGREPEVRHRIQGDNHYRLMVEHFADVVAGREELRYGIADSVANLAVIEALYESARDGGRPAPVRRDA